MNKKIFGCFILFCLAGCGGGGEVKETLDLTSRSWAQIQEAAKGQSLTMMMWQGDPLINDYMENYVRPKLKEQFGIELNLAAGQGTQIVSTLSTELELQASESDLDLVWINGETFFQLREIDALYGPFTERLPNAQFIDFDNPFIRFDFQQEIEGYECPWGNVQLAFIYNQEKVPEPPLDLEALEKWTSENPGKFTLPMEFTGMTVLKSWLYARAGGGEALRGEFDEKRYAQYSAELWDYINRNKANWWKKGETFPNSLAQMHQLFTNGELYFTMSNNDSEVDNKIQQGLFPESSRAYVPKGGTIQNSHYLGIVRHSGHKAAALVAINFLISPEAQLEKMKPSVWGDGTVLDFQKLPQDLQAQFKNIPGRKYAPSRQAIQERALMEPAPAYMIRLYEDFRKKVIEE